MIYVFICTSAEKAINMELKFLLKDEVFVDFFNTFLSLPVR